MADLTRSYDWASTPLGPVESWSQTLRTNVQLMLTLPIAASLFWGADLVLLYNDEYRLFLGARHPGALGQPGSKVWAEAWPTIGPQLEATFLKGEITQQKNGLVPIDKDGEIQDCYWNYSYSPVYEDDRIKGVFNICQNVNEEVYATLALERLTERLQASEQELRWTVDLNAHNPWTADTDGLILDFSPRWLTLTGLTLGQALGAGWLKVLHPDDLSHVVDAWSHSLRTGKPFQVEHRIRTASGEYHWMCTNAFPRRDKAERIVKWYGATEDIDKRKQAEHALILNEKLAAVGRLAASIAHEINNPLETVTNLLYLVQTSPQLTAEARGFLQTAEREIERVSAISRQTLRLHKHSTHPTRVTVQELIEGALSIYRGPFVRSKIKTETRYCSASILCFEGEIRQVLNNLVSNAKDAMDSIGGSIYLRSREATNWSTHQRGLFFTVADTGPGMNPEVLSKVFLPFFTTKEMNGTGLGLWICQEIVARHHGTLRVRTSQRSNRSGTVFTLFLPFEAVAR